MTTFNSHSSLTQHEQSTEQIKELQRAIQENRLKLEEVQQKRLRAEEDIIQCTQETERRVGLMKGKDAVVDLLQQLGHRLQEEKYLSEQLNGQASTDSRNDLKERHDCVTNKARSLEAELLEVKQRLAEAKNRPITAQALKQELTSKPKRNQSKVK